MTQVSFPSDEEDEGQVTVAWRGPNVNVSASLWLAWVDDECLKIVFLKQSHSFLGVYNLL